jgi:hypothetical protein
MAAPMTHFDITFVFRAILLFVCGMEFSIFQLVLIYFWGSVMDFADHFTSPSYTKDVFLVRIPRFLYGGDVGKPSLGVKMPVCWFHIWPGFMLAFACGTFFPFKYFWVPLFFWLQHKLIDDAQENDGSYLEVPFLYPFQEKEKVIKTGLYPVKIRKEILVSTALMFFVCIFELWWNFLK